MKYISPALAALFATKQFFAADLYTVNLVGGGTLRYCSGDASLTSGGNFYPCTGTFGSGTVGGPYFDRTDNKAKVSQKCGVEVDKLVFDVIPGNATLFGEPWLKACQEGQFDGAELLLDRAFMPLYGDTSAGTVNVFTGIVAEVDCGRSISTFTVNSRLEILNEQWPHNLYQPGCVNNLGDPSCGVNLESYKALGSALAGSTQSTILIATSGSDGSVFNLGKILFTSGVLNGLSRSILGCDLSLGYVYLLGPFPVPPAAGDSFAMYYGCDKSQGANGCTKFANIARFRGFPYVPAPTTAL